MYADKSDSLDDGTDLHLIYQENICSYKSLEDFKRFLSIDDEQLRVSKQFKTLKYYNNKGLSCKADVQESKKYRTTAIHVGISQTMIDWKYSNDLPPSTYKPNFKITEPKEE